MNEPIQFYSPADVAAQCGVTLGTVYRYHRELRGRDLTEPIASRWPMEKPDALRFIEYVQKRCRKR